jgi:hypothetical protein
MDGLIWGQKDRFGCESMSCLWVADRQQKAIAPTEPPLMQNHDKGIFLSIAGGILACGQGYAASNAL